MSMVIFSVMFYSKPYDIGCKLITSLLNLLALLNLLLLVSESLSDILRGALPWNSETQSVFIKSIWSAAPFVAIKGLCSLSPIDSKDSLCSVAASLRFLLIYLTCPKNKDFLTFHGLPLKRFGFKNSFKNTL